MKGENIMIMNKVAFNYFCGMMGFVLFQVWFWTCRGGWGLAWLVLNIIWGIYAYLTRGRQE